MRYSGGPNHPSPHHLTFCPERPLVMGLTNEDSLHRTLSHLPVLHVGRVSLVGTQSALKTQMINRYNVRQVLVLGCATSGCKNAVRRHCSVNIRPDSGVVETPSVFQTARKHHTSCPHVLLTRALEGGHIMPPTCFSQIT